MEHDEHRRLRKRGWFIPFCFAGLMAGVALMWNPSVSPLSSTASSTATSSSTTAMATATTTLVFGVPAPKAGSDKLFSVSWPGGAAHEEKPSKGWRLQTLKTTTALRVVLKTDGTFFLMGPDWNVAIRSARGVSYQDVQLLGVVDASHAAVMARTDDTWVLLSVAKFGEVRELSRLPEAVLPLDVTTEGVWLSLFQMGEGLEAPPRGPSTLIRVTLNGTSSTVATDDRVISLVSVGPAGSLAYGFDSGEVVAVLADGSRWSGSGRPLLWLDASHLMFAQGVAVRLVDVSAGQEVPMFDLPAAPMVAVASSTQH